MTFFKMDPLGFPKGAQFYFNLVIATIEISFESDLLPKDIYDYWYLGGIKEARPFAIYIYRHSEKTNDNHYDFDVFEHCVLEVDEDQEVSWYDMVDYETEDPWDPTPTLEDFDDDDDEEDDDDDEEDNEDDYY